MSQFIYNNEGIGAVAILSVISPLKTCSLEKALLILPFYSHKKTTMFLKKDSTQIRSMEEFLVKKGEFFLNFNDRYYSLLPVSINSLILLRQLGAIEINNGIINYNFSFKIDYHSKELGGRALDIIKGSKKLANLLSVDAEQLYLLLKIQL